MSHPPLPSANLDWDDLKTFDRVAQDGTVRRAGESLGVHHSTVARRIDRLEAQLGASLFERHPDGLRLTEAGETLRRTTQPMGDAVIEATRRLSGQTDALSGTVRLTLPPAVAIHVIAPALAEFAARYPDLSLDLLTTTDTLDVARREADIAIRMDNNPPGSLVGKRLFSYYETAYASPAYLADLDAGKAEPRWFGWETGQLFGSARARTRWPNAPVWGGCPDVAVQIAVAAAGAGLVLLPCLCGDADTRLTRADDRPPSKARDVWLLTHDDLRRTARIRAVMDFVEAAMRANRAAFEGKMAAPTQ